LFKFFDHFIFRVESGLVTQEEKRRAAWNELISLLGEIDDSVDVVIVEGQRDTEALRSLGLVKPIFRDSSPGRLQADLVEEIAKSFTRVVILTDFDAEGRDLNRKLAATLGQRGLRVAEAYRRKVGRLLGALKVSTIESLNKLKEEM